MNKFKVGDILIDSDGRILSVIYSTGKKKKYRYYKVFYESNNKEMLLASGYVEKYYKIIV